MTRSLWTIALSALLVGMVAVGCGEEDYSDLDAEYAKMEEGLLTRHSAAMTAFDEMNKAFTTVAVAEDWDTNRRMAYDVAKTRMGEYNTQLQEGKTQSEKWKSDLEAAKKEGRAAYEAKLAEARSWFDQYNAWLDAYDADIERYRASASGTDPWWYVMYGPTPASGNNNANTTADTDTTGDAAAAKTAEEEAEDADGSADDKNAIKEGVRDIIGDDDND